MESVNCEEQAKGHVLILFMHVGRGQVFHSYVSDQVQNFASEDLDSKTHVIHFIQQVLQIKQQNALLMWQCYV